MHSCSKCNCIFARHVCSPLQVQCLFTATGEHLVFTCGDKVSLVHTETFEERKLEIATSFQEFKVTVA